MEEDIGRTSKIREEEIARSNRLRNDITSLTTNLEKHKLKLDEFEAVEAKLKESERKQALIKTELAEAESASEVNERLVKALREELKQVRQESSYGGDEALQKKVDILEKKNKKLNRTIAMLTAKDDDSDDSTAPEVPIKRAKLEEDLRLSESPTPRRSSDSVASPGTARQGATGSPSIMLPRGASMSAAASHPIVQQSQTQQHSPARQTQVQTPPSQAPGHSPGQVQRQGSTGSPQQAQAAPTSSQQFEMEMYEALVEALELAKTQKTPQELKGKYTELLNNLLTNTPYTR